MVSVLHGPAEGTDCSIAPEDGALHGPDATSGLPLGRARPCTPPARLRLPLGAVPGTDSTCFVLQEQLEEYKTGCELEEGWVLVCKHAEGGDRLVPVESSDRIQRQQQLFGVDYKPVIR